MPFQLLIKKGWLRERLESTPDWDIAAGIEEARLAGEMGRKTSPATHPLTDRKDKPPRTHRCA